MRKFSGNVVVAGDWHGDKLWMMKSILWANRRQQANIVVQVGDIGLFEMRDLTFLNLELSKRDMWLLFIDGNHDNHELIATLPRDEHGFGVVSSRIRHIPRGHTFEVNGQVWMGFGGASSIDRHFRTEGVDWWRGELITYDDVMRVQGKRADVLVTHEVPMGVASIDHRYPNSRWPAERLAESEAQRLMLREVFDEVQPSLLLHGHHHWFYTDTLCGARVIGLAKDGSPWEEHAVVVHTDGSVSARTPADAGNILVHVSFDNPYCGSPPLARGI